MTQGAVEALRAESHKLIELTSTLTADEWAAASGCAGWRVQDVVCHMACVFHSVTDPSSIESGPPDDVEASAEVPVQARRSWQPGEVVEYYRHWANLGLEAVAGLQVPPTAGVEVPLGNLGSHPLHLLANALVFDHYCHIRHDIGAAIPRAAGLPHDADALAETRVWMLAGIPQMCAGALSTALTSPVRLVLYGAGGGSWVVRPGSDGGLCRIEEEPDRTDSGEDDAGMDVAGTDVAGTDVAGEDAAGTDVAATVTSDVHDFVSWGTRRRDWRESNVVVTGDTDLAAAVLDAINVI